MRAPIAADDSFRLASRLFQFCVLTSFDFFVDIPFSGDYADCVYRRYCNALCSSRSGRFVAAKARDLLLVTPLRLHNGGAGSARI